MSEKRIFNLSERLYCCGKMIEDNSRIADVGTDHAYLPIWLSKHDRISHAIACDVNPMPLERARKNIKIYNVVNVETRLSNGLEEIRESEVDTVVIAGMGGELIYSILSGVPWTKNKILILQPMSSERDLRIALAKDNYKIQKEVAVKSNGKVYTVMKVKHSLENQNYNDLYPFIGGLLDDENNVNEVTMEYIHKQIRDAEKRKTGEKAKGNHERDRYYSDVIEKMNNIIKKYNCLE